MLVLTVKPGQEVTIDGGITVTFLECKGTSIRLGFQAPDEIGIHRHGNVADCRDDRSRQIERGND